jgi:hypothetical protein
MVLFQLPNAKLGRQFLAEAVRDRSASMDEGGSGAVVGVLLTPDELDLASLLRDVQRWLAGTSLRKLSFELDGRSYLLEPESSNGG